MAGAVVLACRLAERDGASERGKRRRHSNDLEQHSGIRDGRLHAAGGRIEVSRKFHLLRRTAGEGSDEVLEEIRKEGIRQGRRLSLEEEGYGGGSGANRCAGGHAGSETEKDLRAHTADPEYEF